MSYHTPQATGIVPRHSHILYVQVPRAQIAHLRFVVEAYGHLALITVLDRFQAVLKVRYVAHAHEDVRRLLSALGATILLEPEEPPRHGPAPHP